MSGNGVGTGKVEQVSDDRKQDLERINAFVDGELDPAARAEVIREAADDEAFARELIAHERLKATVADTVDMPDLELPAAPRRRRIAPALASIAASLVLLITGAIGWMVYDGRNAGTGDLALDRAIEAHRSWTANSSRGGAIALVRPASSTINAYVPDLSSNGLNINHVSERRAPGEDRLLVVGYLGSRGCRVTLLARIAPVEPQAQPVYLEIGPVRAYSWRAGRLAYRMLAEGMATRRFRLIAASVRKASLNHLPLDPDTRLALAQSRAQSPPCAA